MAKREVRCEICRTLVDPDFSLKLGLAEPPIINAHLLYLILAINHWREGAGYDFGDERKKKVPIHEAQLLDALSEIVEYRLAEGGDRDFLTTGKGRKMITFWRRTGRKYKGEEFDDTGPGDVENA